MKKLFPVLLITFFISCNSSNLTNPEFHENEIVSMVYMKSNEKSSIEIDKFSDYYQSRIKELEPNVLSWKFFRSQNGNIILLERYKNESAIFNHIDNVSEGNPMEDDFTGFIDHFIIDSIEYYGSTSQDFKTTIESFGFPVRYKDLISGFTK